MTTVAVLVDPPRPGVVLQSLSETGPLADDEAARLYRAMTADVLRTAERSGAELLVNYRATEDLPEAPEQPPAEQAVRTLASEALEEPDDARFEVQVGSARAARAANTATHLLETEKVDSVLLLDPRAPTVDRTVLDAMSMKLRRNDTVVGPAPGGRIYAHAHRGAIDFEGVYDPPEVVTVVDRSVAAEHDVGFESMHPVIASEADLVTLLGTVESRLAAGAAIPERTVEALAELDLRIGTDGDRRTVERG